MIDHYKAFLHARNVAERLLRAYSAEEGSYARKYQENEARDALELLIEELGPRQTKQEAA